MLTTEAGDAGVVEIMPLDEWYGGFQRLSCLCPVFYHRLLSLAFDGEVLVHLHVWRSPEHQTYDEADTNLSYDFVFALQSLFVALENLDEVIHTTEETKPYGGDDHQNQIDVAQSAEQQYRYEDGQDDDDATHGWDTDLLYAEWVDAGIALGLGNLLALEVLDELLAKPCRDDE